MDGALTLTLVGTMGLAAALDLKDRKIPNWLTVTGLVVALVLRGLPGGPEFLPGLLGFALAFALVLPLFGTGLLGGGDSKLFMVVGAMLGPAMFLIAFLYASVVGGLMAVATSVASGKLKALLTRSLAFGTSLVSFGRRGLTMSVSDPTAVTIPYGVAIAAGALIAHFYPLLG